MSTLMYFLLTAQVGLSCHQLISSFQFPSTVAIIFYHRYQLRSHFLNHKKTRINQSIKSNKNQHRNHKTRNETNQFNQQLQMKSNKSKSIGFRSRSGNNGTNLTAGIDCNTTFSVSTYIQVTEMIPIQSHASTPIII